MAGGASEWVSSFQRRHLLFIMEVRKKQIWIGVVLISFFFLCLTGVAAFAYLPGYPGEIGRFCLALVTSPFLMETSIAFLALTLLFAINGWRRIREGDDYLHLDENGIPVRNGSVRNGKGE